MLIPFTAEISQSVTSFLQAVVRALRAWLRCMRGFLTRGSPPGLNILTLADQSTCSTPISTVNRQCSSGLTAVAQVSVSLPVSVA